MGIVKNMSSLGDQNKVIEVSETELKEEGTVHLLLIPRAWGCVPFTPNILLKSGTSPSGI